MPTNWPPLNMVWPPAGFTRLEIWDVNQLTIEFEDWTTANPTVAERNTFFASVRCDEGHTVTGLVVVSPDSTRYPYFARCDVNHARGPGHRAVFFPWPPYYASTFPW